MNNMAMNKCLFASITLILRWENEGKRRYPSCPALQYGLEQKQKTHQSTGVLSKVLPT